MLKFSQISEKVLQHFVKRTLKHQGSHRDISFIFLVTITIQEKMKLFICSLIYLLRHSQLGYEVMKVKCFNL